MTSGEPPFFTVIMPAHNAEHYIGEALRSVFSQTFSAFEIIVTNDGSTDGTLNAIAPFAADPRLIVHTTSHCGTSGGARNAGLKMARGQYVAFLDADDVWAPRKLERFHAHIVAVKAPFLFSNGFIIDAAGSQVSRMLSPKMSRVLHPGDPLLLLSCVIPLSSVAVRRDVLADDPFLGDRDILGIDDYRLWLRLNRDLPMHYVPEPLLFYRQHGAQMSVSYQTQLSRLERVFRRDQPQLISTYGAKTFDLAMALVRMRQRLAGKEPGSALLTLLAALRGLDKAGRRSLYRYLRFAALQRARIALLTRLRPGLTFR